jgi:CubicO group peptidase (beta-lactamase class C family)
VIKRGQRCKKQDLTPTEVKVPHLGRIGSILLITVGTSLVYGQLALTPEYERLRRYEGTYEDEGGGTLQIVASPRDSILVAVLDGARYPLKAAGTDLFTNGPGQRVQFSLEPGREGYRLLDGPNAGHLFRRVGPGVPLDERMWSPRPRSRAGYTYAPPLARDDGLPVGVAAAPLDPLRLREMGEAIVAGRYPNVHSVLIAHRGRLLFEEHFYEYDEKTPHALRSATKSVVSALVGIAITKGHLKDVRQPVLPFFADEYPQIANNSDEKRRMTVEDLLTMRSGLDCDDWNQASPGNESKMARSVDWVKFTLDLPVRSLPGTSSSYCSGGVIVLGRLVEKVSGKALEAFAREHLFEPLGIRTFEWRFDPDRSSINTFCQLSLTPRDMVKFGLLYLNGGMWNGRQVLPADWVKASTARHTSLDDMEYGYLWWRPYLEVPGGRHHGIMATGNGGQKIFLWPALDMVVVMTGGNYNASSPANELAIKYILPPLRGGA